MKISRRDFINVGAKGFLGGMIVYSIPSLLRDSTQTDDATRSVPAANLDERNWKKHYWGFVVDNERCIGCGRCVVACKLENKVPWEPEYNRTWVERYIISEDGVVLVDQEHCIGCRYCIQACPYGARFMLPDFSKTHFGQVREVDKCTWCYHRITRGLLPACVEVCPVGARIFGDLRNPQSPVRQILREKRIYVLKRSLGTEPKVYYVGCEKGVR